jgi:acyl CoA:acetate/3-ketoacid CoA transferase alpha subunit
MTLFSFTVEYDQVIWSGDNFGELSYGGTQRAQQTYNVVAESRTLAEGEVINNRNFYDHQHPVIKSVTETPVNRIVLRIDRHERPKR